MQVYLFTSLLSTVSTQTLLHQFRPSKALHTNLLRITTELWEIPVFSPADGALIWQMITKHYIFGVIFFPILEREPRKRVMKKALSFKRRLAAENGLTSIRAFSICSSPGARGPLVLALALCRWAISYICL